MTDLKEVIKKAKEYSEIETGDLIKPLFIIANDAGQVLAEKLNANKDIVMLGTLFMDLKRNQAVKENRLQDHTKMSLDAGMEFLAQFNIDKEIMDKIPNCIEAHHGDIPYKCIEAEIVANADCYKFLHPKGFIQFIGILSKRTDDFAKNLNDIDSKLDEKWKILSLDICKKELEEYYHMFKKIISKAKE